MGSCPSRSVDNPQPDTKGHISPEVEDKQIKTYLQQSEKQDQSEKKLLLLGTGGSGKSTLFKSLKCIHKNGFKQSELLEARNVIRQNLVAGIITLLRKSQELYDYDPVNFNNCQIDMNNQDTILCIREIMLFANESFMDELNWDEVLKLGIAIKQLWENPAIKNTYVHRGRFSFPDNVDYFFQKSDVVMTKDYFPSIEDLLRARVRTTGMVEYVYEENNNVFKIHDVGGQRNERRKWIHQFENVSAVLFVIALNHYDAVLFEDERRNAMHESLELFDEIANNKWFRKSEIILFLNKADLFKEKLLQEIPLSICFHKNVGWTGENEQWNGPDYHPIRKNNSNEIDEIASIEYFNQCYGIAIAFIRTIFFNRNKQKTMFFHVTCATDSNSLQQVFWDVQSIAIRANLHRSGLVS